MKVERVRLVGLQRVWQVCVLALLLSIWACGPSEVATDLDSVAVSESQEKLSAPRIVEARVHFLPGGHGAAYLRVENGPTADRLLSIDTPVASAVELHESVEDEGVMRMVPHPDGFDVPAGGLLELVPGGRHAMLMGAANPEGKTVALTLHFEHAGAIEVSAQALGIPGAPAAAPMDHGSMDHGSMDHGS